MAHRSLEDKILKYDLSKDADNDDMPRKDSADSGRYAGVLVTVASILETGEFRVAASQMTRRSSNS